jgi:hypothetical protein
MHCQALEHGHKIGHEPMHSLELCPWIASCVGRQKPAGGGNGQPSITRCQLCTLFGMDGVLQDETPSHEDAHDSTMSCNGAPGREAELLLYSAADP